MIGPVEISGDVYSDLELSIFKTSQCSFIPCLVWNYFCYLLTQEDINLSKFTSNKLLTVRLVHDKLR